MLLQGMRVAEMGGTAAVFCVLYRSAEVSWCGGIVHQQFFFVASLLSLSFMQKVIHDEIQAFGVIRFNTYAFGNLLRRGPFT